MTKSELLKLISQGRTDSVLDLIQLPDWKDALQEGSVKALQWLVYYNDVTALKLVLANGADFSSININDELGNAAFFGHWKVCGLLIQHGADVNYKIPETNETPLHNALAKAGRPYFLYTVRLLLEHGADVHATTVSGAETGGFMRDVRCKGETPLHRAAAFADPTIIQCLLDHGADKEARDAAGDSPLTWASWHQRPGSVLQLLAFGEHRISDKHVEHLQSDHGTGWGNGMDWNLMGDYVPLSLS